MYGQAAGDYKIAGVGTTLCFVAMKRNVQAPWLLHDCCLLHHVSMMCKVYVWPKYGHLQCSEI